MTTATFEPHKTSTLDQPITDFLALTWEKAAYLALIVLAFISRFYDLGARVMSHDESLHTQFSWYLYQGRGFQHTPLMHGPLKFELTALMYWLFGDNDFTARIPTAILGVVAVGLCYYFRKWIGRTGALVAAVIMLISPYQLYYARYIRDEQYVMVWGLLMALLMFNYMEKREVKYLYWLAAVTSLFYATMETSFIYIAIAMVFLALHFVYDLYITAWPDASQRQPFIIAVTIGIVAALVGVGIFFYKDRLGLEGTAFTPSATSPDDPASVNSPLWLVADVAWLTALICGVIALAVVMRAFGKDIRRFGALDLLMVLGIFALPQLAAFPVKALGFNPLDYALPADPALWLSSSAFVTALVTFGLLAASVVFGYIWNFPVFLVCAAIFYGIYIPLYTTFFTNGGGLASGIVGSLGYWLEQHGVRRGSQPWYYYLVITMPMYEFLAVSGALLAGAMGLRRVMQSDSPAIAGMGSVDSHDMRKTLGFPVLGYIGFWAVMATIAFSIAGEKMSWLTTHITLPMILLAGWAIGRIIDGVDWALFRERRAWLVAVLLLLAIIAGLGALGAVLGATPPFQGMALEQLQATTAFVLAALVLAGALTGLWIFGQPLGGDQFARLAALMGFGLMAVLTARAAFIANYINYDSANEFIVYAHGARGVKTVLAQVEAMSVRTTDGLGMRVAYDADVSWPMTWYLRDFTNQLYYSDNPTRELLDAPAVIAGPKNWSRVEALLGDKYFKFEYIRMVWPMQDYFDLTWERIASAWTSADMRQALFDIWLNRDFKRYGQITGVNFDLAQWPVAERMRFYVRKDIAAQMWELGVGPAVALPAPVDPYAQGRQVRAATDIWGSFSATDLGFNAPRGLAVAPDGAVFIADSRNHRIVKYSPTGAFMRAWGRFGQVDAGTGAEGTFNEPWGVAVSPDGEFVYVADTWNHRIQQFTANGDFVRMWGTFGDGATFDAFYGPRAIAVDAQGNVYVTDTGNKRVVVFDSSGRGLTSIGTAGFEAGQLDEPVGLAVSADGNTVYVADTWNGRVQVFVRNAAIGEYLYQRQFPVNAWNGQQIDNKPYLAVDAQGRIYVTDPKGYRVLVFDNGGQFITTWGEFGIENTNFALPVGIAVSADNRVFVTDSDNHRLMVFPALP